jgi:hypothetical protein
MTEQEWLAAEHPNPLLESSFCASTRALRLFACACARRVLPFLTDTRFADALRATEESADVTPMWTFLRRTAAEAQGDLTGRPSTECEQRAAAAIYWACEQDSRQYFRAGEQSRLALGADAGPARHFALAVEEQRQAAIVRDIFGNPFRPSTFPPTWRTDTVVSLAHTMYNAREFSAMPILADALQDAGCDNDDILNHCRDTNPAHVRGCWVVDLVLGK